MLTTSALLFIGDAPLINRKDVQAENIPSSILSHLGLTAWISFVIFIIANVLVGRVIMRLTLC